MAKLCTHVWPVAQCLVMMWCGYSSPRDSGGVWSRANWNLGSVLGIVRSTREERQGSWEVRAEE